MNALEVVGSCVQCGKTVYCDAGFLQGVQLDGQLYCLACAEKQ